jgi:hypothetical protein
MSRLAAVGAVVVAVFALSLGPFVVLGQLPQARGPAAHVCHARCG